MPNNINALPSSGPISLQDIANAFYLYKSYSDGGSVDLSVYYGDNIRKYNSPSGPNIPFLSTYSPSAPPIATSFTKKLDVDPFHGKRFTFPINLIVNTPIKNYNVYDQAALSAKNAYGFNLNTPGIPFNITVINNSTISSSATTGPGITPGSYSVSTPGTTYTWTIPANTTSVNILVAGAGGGGGGGGGVSGAVGGGGGGGGGVIVTNNIPVIPGMPVTITVGKGGQAGTFTTQGDSGGTSTLTIGTSSFSALGGGGGYPAPNGPGGNYGGPGGATGGTGTTKGGSGGLSLTSPAGTGGAGGGGNGSGGWTADGIPGNNGIITITWANVNSNTTNTLGTAAMVIGTSSDGSKVFNQNTIACFINGNSGTIVGAADTSPVVTCTGAGSFYVNQGEANICYKLLGGGGQGGHGGAADHHVGQGQHGGTGGCITGSVSVKQGDLVCYGGGSGGTGGSYVGIDGSPAVLCINGNVAACAPGGGGGGGYGTDGQTYYAGSNGVSYSGGGCGGSYGGYTDGNWSGHCGGSGYPGSATVCYQPNLPGGPALYLTKKTSITNNGNIIGGSSSIGTVGAGNAIIGCSCIDGTIQGSGKIYGHQI